MAQIVKLKRTSVQGKVPTVSNVELGELAINTYDGRIFFEKSSSNESIQEILTTNTGRPITGSININGAITASYFKGDGSALTNIQATVSEQVTVTSSFDAQSTIDVAHNFSSKNVIVSVYDSNDNQIIPQTVSLTDTDTVRVVLSAAQSGFVVVAKGGHIVSGSADDSNRLNGQLASYYLNYNNFTNVPSGLVSGSSQIDVTQTTNYGSINQYSDTKVKTKLDAENVLSGSSHSGDQTFDDNVIVTGNLTVNGTTTSVNSNTVNIGDNIIVLNSDESGTPSQDAGIEVERGTSTNVRFQFKESTDRWQFSNDGSTYFNLPTSTADVAEFSNLYYTDTRVKTKLDTDGVVSGSSQVVSLLSNQDVDLGTGDLTATDITSTNFTINDTLTASTITGSLLRLSENGTGLRMTNVGAFDNASGSFRVFSNQNLILATNGQDGTAVTFDETTKDATFVGNIIGSISATNGVISGSSQITDLTTHKETVSGASSYTVDHNLGEQYPIVQAWNTATSQQELPNSITTNSTSRVTVVFSTTFAGIIIVKK
jgi:hypothetical protein